MHRTNTKYAPSIRWKLVGLVLACIIPATLLAAVLIAYDYRLTYQNFTDSAMATARAHAMEIDKEFALVESALVAFSTSPDFHLQNLQQLDIQARKLVARQNIFSIVLENRSGQQLFNTFMPYGSALPHQPDSPSLRFMRANESAYISDVFSGPVTGRRMVSVGVPGKTTEGDWLALTATLPLERYGNLLREQHFPEHWIATVFDRSGKVVVQLAQTEQLPGTDAQAPVLDQIQREGVFESRALNGESILAVTARAPRSGWTVAIGIPLAQLKAEMRRKIWSLVLATMGLLSIGLLFAWKIGNTIRQAMHGLIAPATALGSGQALAHRSYGVREADEVGEALLRAAAMLESAQHQATHDVLTGLANRMMFNAFLEKQLAAAQREQSQFSVLYLDLDKFKPINDTYGHAIGDKLLIEASARLTSQLRKSDLAVRLGGDEFAVVVSGGAKETAFVADKLGNLMARPYSIDGIELQSNASIGIATYPQSGATVESLLAAADKAMYLAKANRRGRRPPAN